MIKELSHNIRSGIAFIQQKERFIVSKQFSYDLQILENHLDTFGHVNNSKYLELFELARWDIIHDKGWGVDDIKKKGQGPVVLELSIKYLSEVRNRDNVTILSTSDSWEGKIGKFSQVMMKGDKVAAKIDLVFGFFDTSSRGLVDPPNDWLEVLGVK